MIGCGHLEVKQKSGDAEKIAQEIIADKIIFAKFEDDGRIYYEYEYWDENE